MTGRCLAGANTLDATRGVEDVRVTAPAFTDVLPFAAARADGWTTCSSSVCGERYEDVYLRAYETPTELRTGLARYFGYNTKRRHSALDRRTPDAVYFDQAHRDLAA